MHDLAGAMWLVWLGVALVAGVAEVATLSLVFAMIAGGAMVGAGVAAVGAPVELQIVVFAAVSALLLGVVRPTARKWMERTTEVTRTGVEALRGRQARAVTAVTVRGGEVKLAGETWSARAVDDTILIEPGTVVEVVGIDGATAIVRLPDPLPHSPDR